MSVRQKAARSTDARDATDKRKGDHHAFHFPHFLPQALTRFGPVDQSSRRAIQRDSPVRQQHCSGRVWPVGGLFQNRLEGLGREANPSGRQRCSSRQTQKRLFTSSSRLDQGLDEIVSQGAPQSRKDDRTCCGGSGPETSPSLIPHLNRTRRTEPAPSNQKPVEPEPVEPEPVEPEPIPEPGRAGRARPRTGNPESSPKNGLKTCPKIIPGYPAQREMPPGLADELPPPAGDTMPGPAPIEIPFGIRPKYRSIRARPKSAFWPFAWADSGAAFGCLGPHYRGTRCKNARHSRHSRGPVSACAGRCDCGTAGRSWF